MLTELEIKCLSKKCDVLDIHILKEYYQKIKDAEYKQQHISDISTNSDNDVELLCNAQIRVNKKDEIVVDLRKTTCDPEKAKELLERITKKSKTIWKMPGSH